MAVLESSKMRVSWIIADAFASATIDPEQLKSLGPIWGSWRTWRAWNTDNVLCGDLAKSQELLQRAFQAVCNFYVPAKNFALVGRPSGVKTYEGHAPAGQDCADEIVAMHLAASSSDLVLLLGYDLQEITTEDRYQRHTQQNYAAVFRATLNCYPQVQWVIIDHPGDLQLSVRTIANLTCDQFESVLQLLN